MVLHMLPLDDALSGFPFHTWLPVGFLLAVSPRVLMSLHQTQNAHIQTTSQGSIHVYIYIYISLFVDLMSLTCTSCTVPFIDDSAARRSNKVIQGISSFY